MGRDAKKAGKGDPPGDVFSIMVNRVSGEIGGAVKDSGGGGVPFPEVLGTVIQGVVRDAIEAGADLTLAAKGIVVGVLRGTGEREDAALKSLSQTARGVIHQAALMEGDLAASAKGLVLGAIASARDIGVEREKASSAAARGALEAAGEAGTAASEKVRHALKETIGGVKVELGAPLKGVGI